MTISKSDLRLLFQRSGNRCAFPGCVETLTLEFDGDEPIPISEVAHIVAQSINGPRGTYPLPKEERDNYSNLILLCEHHHEVVDLNPASYPVEMLRRWKSEHENLIQRATEAAVEKRQTDHFVKQNNTEEVVYSTLLPVLQMPKYIYSTACKYLQADFRDVKDAIIYPEHGSIACPFILRENRLYCFNNLRNSDNPFREVIVVDDEVTRHHSRDWWMDEDKEKWFVYLLNQCLNKLTGWRGLNWDREHSRYYFQPKVVGQPLEVSYQPLNQSTSTRQVVWNPITKKTGVGKSYWFHLAVSLRFHHVSSKRWCLSIRPEMHVTSDGSNPYPSTKKGSRITKRKSRRFNYDLLGDIQFWRDYLSDSRPRITLNFGDHQYLSISNQLMNTIVSWPGTPEEHNMAFTNVIYEEDLFTLPELRELEDIFDDEWDDDDE